MTQGDPYSRIWIVGEAPGETEVRTGVPFSGPSGALLDRCLKSVGINRSDCFITNVCHERPPGNDISQWFDRKETGWRSWAGRWMHPAVWNGIRTLEARILDARPPIIVALGDTAMWALAGKRGILTWRGSILSCQFRPETMVVPTLHPAFVLRNAEWQYELMADLMRAAAGPYREPDWRFHLNPSVDEAIAFIERLPDPFVADIETSRNQIVCIGLGASETEAMCIPMQRHSVEEEMTLIEALRRAFAAKRVVGQNFLYDAFYLALLWGVRSDIAHDTMVAQGCLFPGRPKSLDYLASLYSDWYVYWKRETKEDNASWSEQELWTYNCFDCVYTWRVWQSQLETIAKAGQQRQFRFLMDLLPPVHEMMLRGVRCDERLKDSIAQMLDGGMEQRLSWLRQVLGEEINPLSPVQLKRLFYEELKIPAIISRKTSKPTTDDDALGRIAMREPVLAPVVKWLREYRTMHLLKANVLDAKTPGGRMYTAFNPVGTSTFRFNSTANPMGWGTNLQNIFKREDDDPEKQWLPPIRQLFLPDEGMVLLEFDLSKADLRVVVWESGEPELKEALRRGVNIYRDIASDIVRMPYRKAKMFVHGTNYGGTARTMAINCGITVHEAEVAQSRWFGKFPGIRRWHERVRQELERHRRVSNRFGFRILYFGRVDGLLPEALAWGPQSTVAIVTNMALRRIWERQLGELLLQVHDSVMLQCPPDDAGRVAREVLGIYDSIVVPYDDPLIIPAECKIGLDWHNMHDYRPCENAKIG